MLEIHIVLVGDTCAWFSVLDAADAFDNLSSCVETNHSTKPHSEKGKIGPSTAFVYSPAQLLVSKYISGITYVKPKMCEYATVTNCMRVGVLI